MTESEEILKKLKGLSESKLRRLIENYSKDERCDSAELHGTEEHGLDVITLVKPERDFFGLEQVFLFQVKKSKITLGEWRNTLSGQLSELYFRRIRALNINENAPRRIVLVYNEMTPSVHAAISDWNKKLPIPIETKSLNNLAVLLEREGYKARDINRLIQ